ncbi:MAG TPA: hypothetical protein VKB65_12370 [Myxococcota bacterium]|nr:hypothetical protein [Myxococcota bacterium]
MMFHAPEAPPAERPAASPRGALRPGPLAAGVALALLGLTACVAPSSRPVSLEPGVGAEAHDAIADGVRLYEAGEFAMAARRFEAGAGLAEQIRDLPLAWRATAAECTSWLLARDLRMFDGCSVRLETIQGRNHESSGGTNALIALGAVAGGRPQPAVNIPSAVRTVMRPGQEPLR